MRISSAAPYEFDRPQTGANWCTALRSTTAIQVTLLAAIAVTMVVPRAAGAQVVAFDMVGSSSQNLNSHINPFDGAFTSGGDGFQKYQRGVSSSIPFSVLDDSLSIFPGDTLGIVKEGNTDVFFGVTDTENSDNSGPVSATWSFDISGAVDMVLSIDMGAMGDFESSDDFTWTYSIDGGPAMTAFASSVDESASFTYTLEGGADFTLNDPMLMQGTILSNNFQTFSTSLSGAGSELVLTLTASTNGGTEAFAFQNIVLSEGALVPGIVAFDMVASMSQNLNSHTNPFDGAFTSAGDGFQKYQRGVSSSIPFSVLDDSLSIFPGDTLGIIKEGNTDVFFGVTDTENSDNSGPVSAIWSFDISGAADMVLSIDMGAMGDFESSDDFTWTYSIDGGPAMTAFASSVDESASFTYTLEGGADFTLNDPMLMQGTILSNNFQTFSTSLLGAGSELTVTLTASTNGGTEAFAFQNILITEGGPPLGAVAFDMVASTSENLISFTNPFNGAFGSAGDGFQKYRRFVSSSIPFSVLDDSLSIFTGDTLGIVKEGNTDIFFGVTDTENSDNSGPVSAIWVFDVSGAAGLGLSIDMGAMGDFESSDDFTWTYSIDGGPAITAFASSVDESASFTYTLEGGADFTLNDPMLVQGTILSNNFQTFSTSLSGAGSELTVTLTASTNGGTEAFAFQNIIVTDGNPPPPDPPELEIFEIQGSGPASTFNGFEVVTSDNVVTALASNGFFMQTPAARSDGDVDTSDGIFVFTGASPGVAVGDTVDVIGEVDEFFGFTEISGTSLVSVVGTGTVPAAVLFDDTVPSPDPTAPSCSIEYECYEGMLIDIPLGQVTGPNQGFGSDPIAEVHIAAGTDRTFREPGIEFPGIALFPVWDGNPEVFELDPDKLGLPNEIIPAGSSFSATGILGFEFGGYELWPTSLTVAPATIPVAVRARGDEEITVGSLNLFRLFDDINDPSSTNFQGGTRNDAVVSTAEYAIRRAKFVDYILNVLDAPDVLAVQEVESVTVLAALAADILAADATVNYSAHLLEGNDIGTIDVGFLVRDTIQVDSVSQVGLTDTFVDPSDNSVDILHDRPPLLLEATCTNAYGSQQIKVLAVHNRSLSGIDGGSGVRIRQKRYEQAQAIAQFAQDEQTADPDVALVITGDFNAFQFTDGFVDAVGQIVGDFTPADNLICDTNPCPDLVDPNLTNQVLSLPAEEQYSFIFRGNAQVLDHALTTSALDPYVRGFEYGRGNADAAEIHLDDPGNPLASSDHDGLVLFLVKDGDGDGVPDDVDVCTQTVIPESVPTQSLGRTRYALVDDDGVFDTAAGMETFTIHDTAGCSCEQIIQAQGLGKGHTMFGCSIGEMKEWVDLVNP